MEPLPLNALLSASSATKRKDFCNRLHADGFCLLWVADHEGVSGLEDAARRFFSRSAQDKEAAQVSTRASEHEPPGYVRLYDYELLQLRRGEEHGGGASCAELAVLMKGFDFFHSTGLALLQILQHHWQTEPVPGETTNLMSLVTGGPSASLLRFVHYDRSVHQLAPCSGAEPSEGDTDGEEVFEDHKDFGLLTLVPISRVPGLHLWEAGALGHDARWIPVEEVYAPQRAGAARNGFHLLVFCGETMDHATASYFPAVRHKVVLRPSQVPCSSLGRISSPFFLRALPYATVPRLYDRAATYSVSEFEDDYDQTH